MKRFLFLALVLCGCNSTKPIGKVGDVEFYKVHSNNLGGPSLTALVTKSNGIVRIESVISEGLSVQAPIASGVQGSAMFQGYGVRSGTSAGGLSPGIRLPSGCPTCIAPL